MTRSLPVTALSCALLLTGGTAYAETATLKNPNWQEVPGTRPSGNDSELGPAYIDVRGMVQRGNIRVYDMVGEDGQYARHELDCTRKQLRQLRRGDFQSKTRVTYIEIDQGWEPATAPLAKFVCRH